MKGSARNREDRLRSANRAAARAARAAKAGQLDKAVADYRTAVSLAPDLYEAYTNLGVVLIRQGWEDQAVAAFLEALQINGDCPLANWNLGRILQKRGDPEAACERLRKAARHDPPLPGASVALAECLAATGKRPEAIDVLTEAAQHDPRAHVLHQLALHCFQAKRLADAENACRKAMALEPNAAGYHTDLGLIYLQQGRFAPAEQAFNRAMSLDPRLAAAYDHLATLRKHQGRAEEAVALHRRALELSPDSAVGQSNLLMALHYLPDLDPQELLAEHKRWGDRFSSAISAEHDHPNDPDPDRPLRIGYLSPDIRTHSVAFFLEPILDARTPAAVSNYAYAHVAAPDGTTRRLIPKFQAHRSVVGKTDRQVAALIRNDRIDILVDLAGHTGGNRLRVLAHKPAPIQVTYLGYPGTTGLGAVDYRLTDAVADPPGNERFHTEKLVRLPEGFLCYRPPADTPPVAPLPALANGYVTFGSFNSQFKINRHTLDLWAQVLAAVPSSRMLLKFLHADVGELRSLYRGRFAQRGVDPCRIEVLPPAPTLGEHLETYRLVDVCLDTFPYHGTTTTCEALWMGVPVVTLVGAHHASRVGLSLLTAVGIEPLGALRPEEYVTTAAELASNLAKLSALRQAPRGRMQVCRLCDAESFTRQLEGAYRRMWRQWCRRSVGRAGRAGR